MEIVPFEQEVDAITARNKLTQEEIDAVVLAAFGKESWDEMPSLRKNLDTWREYAEKLQAAEAAK